MPKDEKSGYTRKTKDRLGQEKEEHFDSSGKKIGETRFTKDFLGFSRQEHFNSRNEKIGETRKGVDMLGGDRAEHFNSQGKRIGYSKDATNFFGGAIQKHYDTQGKVVGSSERRADAWGQLRREHKGTFYKAGTAQAKDIVASGRPQAHEYTTAGALTSESYFSRQLEALAGQVCLGRFLGAIYWWLCIGFWIVYLVGSFESGGPDRFTTNVISGLASITHLTNDPVLNFIIIAVLVVLGLALAPGAVLVGLYLMVGLIALAIPISLLSFLIAGIFALGQISVTGTIVAITLGALLIWIMLLLIRKAAPWMGSQARRSLSVLLPGVVKG